MKTPFEIQAIFDRVDNIQHETKEKEKKSVFN